MITWITIFPVFSNTPNNVNPTSPEDSTNTVTVNWLENKPENHILGVTWGVPWKQGALKEIKSFLLKNNGSSETYPVQTWPLAYWPDGSIKWTAHASIPRGKKTESMQLIAQKIKPASELSLVEDSGERIVVNTGILKCIINRKGNILISSIQRQGNEIAREGKLVVIHQDSPDTDDSSILTKNFYEGNIEKATIEQNGSIRVVVKLEGRHLFNNKSWLPYILRLYFYKGSEAIKIVHTIIIDGNEKVDFIKGIGIQFQIPLQGQLHNRHIRFVGDNNGVFAEAVRGLTGLRRDPGNEICSAQIEGRETRPLDSFPVNIAKELKYIPAFGDYTLSQLNNNAFTIQKRTGKGCSWLNAGFGKRSSGTAYLGTPKGGLVFGIRNFWQSFPAQLDIRNANSDLAKVTLWLWSPDAPAMDLRFYHDGMGQNTYALQNEGLDITYEDYEPGFSTANGIARTSELSIWALEKTPSNEYLAQIAENSQNPPLLVCTPEYIKQQEVFGNNWSLPDYNTPAKALIEQQLDWNIKYYLTQIEQRGWYGFWNFGDVMHAYDTYRHVWRYDVGGYAWDNSELSTDLWIWYYFLRTGKADVYRMAEAMTRHTGEVDVYHAGPFAPLGSRHNVMHWGCSAKQLRISTAANRRFLYYLTADERTGDLLREQINGLKKLHEIVPTRKRIKDDPRTKPENIVLCSFGTDWGAIAAAWLTEWERTRDTAIRSKLINSMKSIAQQPRKFFTGNGYMDIHTGKFEISTSDQVSVSHLNAVFGLTEICEELIQLMDVPEFTNAWLQYCRLYNASPEQQQNELGAPLVTNNLRQSHSRLTAYAAWYTHDKTLGKESWIEFYSSRDSISSKKKELKIINPPQVLNSIIENPNISTNEIAQWGLAAIQCLAYISNCLP